MDITNLISKMQAGKQDFKRGQIAVDFDGVLASISEDWNGTEDIGAPMPGAEQFLIGLKQAGYNVIVFTAREPIQVADWLKTHKLQKYVTKTTSVKPAALAYIDDRAINFNGDFNDCLRTLSSFKPYWKIR
jgi:hypothetical protein